RPDLSEKDRESLLDRKAYNLHNLGRIDDLLAHYDRRIAAARVDTRKTLALLRDKAQWISYHNRPEQVQAAWRAYRAAAKPGTEEPAGAVRLKASPVKTRRCRRPASLRSSEALADLGVRKGLAGRVVTKDTIPASRGRVRILRFGGRVAVRPTWRPDGRPGSRS